MVFLPSESSPVRKQLHSLLRVFKLEGPSSPGPIPQSKGCPVTRTDIMLGSYSKAELVKTLAGQICPLQHHPCCSHSTSGLPSRYSLSLFLLHLWYFFFPHLLHREIILHYLLSTKISVGFNLINLMAHFLAIKILKIEGIGLAHPFCFHVRVTGISAFRVDRLSELIESSI